MFNKLINTLKYSTKILIIINTNHKNSIFEREDVIWSTLSALQPLKICLKLNSNEDRDWHYTEKKNEFKFNQCLLQLQPGLPFTMF